MNGARNAIVWLSTALCVMLGCGVQGQAVNTDSSVPAGRSLEEDFGTVIRQSRWPTRQILVCWENLGPSDTDKHFAAITKKAVEDTWENYSKVRFTGWNACEANDLGIHVKVSDELPHTMAIGRFLNGYPSGMVLNFRFLDFGSTFCTARGNDFCVYAVAVHEFGHALGFTHEQKSADTRAVCDSEPNDFQGDYLVVAYDPNSIMNLCNKNWNGSGELSNLDREAVARFYS